MLSQSHGTDIFPGRTSIVLYYMASNDILEVKPRSEYVVVLRWYSRSYIRYPYNVFSQYLFICPFRYVFNSFPSMFSNVFLDIFINVLLYILLYPVWDIYQYLE